MMESRKDGRGHGGAADGVGQPVAPGARWGYELTSEVDNIEVAPGPDPDTHILRIHQCWLRYVVTLGEFKSCVADEVEAWHLLAQLTAGASAAA